MGARSAQAGSPGEPDAGPGAPVEVRRSSRRRRTVTAYRDGGTVVVCIPAGFSAAQERAWVARMVARLAAQDQRRRPSDEALARRAVDLSERYLAGRPRPASVRWVANQSSRWGSTTTTDGTIRLSDRLQGMPPWVVDYVLVHELAHLLEHSHGEAFWALVAAYPRAERARGYLEGVAAAGGLPSGEVDDGADPTTPLDGH
jgi:predicted metal-dependent hydrolase